MKFNKGKYQVLHEGRNNHYSRYRTGASQVKSNSAEWNLGVMVDSRTMSQQCITAAEAADGILGFIRKSVTNRMWDMILLLSKQW